MKAIATLAVLGLAYAGERKENPRFRIDRKVVTAHNNNDVLNIDFDKDFANVPGVHTTKDFKDVIPRDLRDLVKDVKVDHRVFTAQNNTGVITINMDDADDEFIGVTWKNKDINAGHNSGRMDININNDDADNELRTTTTVHANDNNGMMLIMGHDDELMMVPRWRDDIRRPLSVAALDDADDELFLDFTNKHTHVNANHNSGMMNINVHNHDDELMMIPRWRDDIRRPLTVAALDDADNELASWGTDRTYYFPKQGKQDGPDYVQVRTQHQVNEAIGNTGVRIINRDDAETDNDLFAFPHIPVRPGEIDYIRMRNPGNYRLSLDDDADNELIGVTWKNKDIIASHNSGRMDININNDDELMMIPRWRTDLRRPPVEADDELFLDFTNKHTHVNANHNSGMMNINVHNHDDELMMMPRWRDDIRRPVSVAALDDADDELFLDFTNKHTHVDANHNSGMMNVNIHNDDADNELLQLGALLRSLRDKKSNNSAKNSTKLN